MTDQDTTNAQQVLDRNMTTFNARDIEGYLANQQPDVEFVLSGGITLHGRDQVRHYIEALWKAFPDGKLAFGEQVFAEMQQPPSSCLRERIPVRLWGPLSNSNF
jgi:hypothetical protein